MKALLIIPPFTQINTTYPSVTQLSGFLNSKGHDVFSVDLSLNVFLRIFCSNGLKAISKAIKNKKTDDEYINRSISLFERYVEIIDSVIYFLQGNNPTYANVLVKDGYIPQGKNFPNDEYNNSAFGDVGIYDRAKHYAALMIGDIYSVINAVVTPHYGLSKYAESIAQTPPEFGGLLNEVNRERNIIEKFIIEETEKVIQQYKPSFVGFSIPFPGNLLSGLISAKYIKDKYKNIKISFGGGYVNTELRKLSDKRIFDFVDFITYDDGELPLLQILNNLENNSNKEWIRTLTIENGELVYLDNAVNNIFPFKDLPKPSYKGIEIGKYVSMLEMLNPMHRLWSDGYWNKLSVAHGCYWQKCTFCDITLDYIKRYSPANTVNFVKIIDEIKTETGKNTFHFTDEAAPPSKLKELALELLKQKSNICWWGNIRFDKAFNDDLCRLLSYSGCIAVSGGIEIAEPRLLELINKGVTIEQAAQVTNNFKKAGILVHSYLMYGYPTQTEQETINSLEMVRQFIKNGLIQSAFWHKFALTIHSPIAQNPKKYGIKILSSLNNPFANNDLKFKDLSSINHDKFTKGLNYALYNYMHGIGLDWSLSKWFDISIPKPTIDKNLISKIITKNDIVYLPEKSKTVVWEGTIPEVIKQDKSIRILKTVKGNIEGIWELDYKIAAWLKNMAAETVNGMKTNYLIFDNWAASFPYTDERKEKFFKSNCWKDIRNYFLIVV